MFILWLFIEIFITNQVMLFRAEIGYLRDPASAA